MLDPKARQFALCFQSVVVCACSRRGQMEAKDKDNIRLKKAGMGSNREEINSLFRANGRIRQVPTDQKIYQPYYCFSGIFKIIFALNK